MVSTSDSVNYVDVGTHRIEVSVERLMFLLQVICCCLAARSSGSDRAGRPLRGRDPDSPPPPEPFVSVDSALAEWRVKARRNTTQKLRGGGHTMKETIVAEGRTKSGVKITHRARRVKTTHTTNELFNFVKQNAEAIRSDDDAKFESELLETNRRRRRDASAALLDDDDARGPASFAT